jgi:hypothetical protein
MEQRLIRSSGPPAMASPPPSNPPPPFAVAERCALWPSLASWTPGATLPREASLAALESAQWLVAAMVIRGAATATALKLEQLFALYGDSGLPAGSDAEAAQAWKAWLEDLADAPVECVDEAIRLWRRSPARRRPMTAGQLMAPMADEIERRRLLQRKVAAALQQARAEAAAIRAGADGEPTPGRLNAEERAKGAAVLRDLARQLRLGGRP